VDQLICPNCGAPLPASAASQDVITCQYCSITFRIPKSFTPEPDMGNLILGANFRQNPVPGWGFPNKDNVQCINGTPPELRFNYPAKKGVWYALNSSGFFDNVDVSVTIKFYAGHLDYIDAGLMLRYRKDIGSYSVLVSAIGSYVVGAFVKGTNEGLDWKGIMGWTRHSALRQGLNQTNRLRVLIKDDQLRVYLNGVLATSIRDSRFTEGEILLAGEGTDKSSFDVGYSDLQVREVKG